MVMPLMRVCCKRERRGAAGSLSLCVCASQAPARAERSPRDRRVRSEAQRDDQRMPVMRLLSPGQRRFRCSDGFANAGQSDTLIDTGNSAAGDI